MPALARGLAGALRAALAPGAPAAGLAAAREAAEILGLEGLGRLLEAVRPHAGRGWPAELEPVRDRLTRMAARAEETGSLEAFREASAQLEALAGEAGAFEWSLRPAGGRRVATLAASIALDDLPYADDRSRAAARRARLTPQVAAALRAALDWLSGDDGPGPIRARAEESAFEVACEAVDPTALEAAESVIAGVDGSLGPSIASGATGWILRVPAISPRDHYMMFEQGGLALAVPWHSVLRLHVLPAGEVAEFAARHGMEVLPAIADAPAAPDEMPVIAVAHGLRRGWIVTDRLVWRLAADPAEPAPEARRADLDRGVVTDEGEVFAVVDVARRLAHVAPAVAAFERATVEALDAPEGAPDAAVEPEVAAGTAAAARPAPAAPEPRVAPEPRMVPEPRVAPESGAAAGPPRARAVEIPPEFAVPEAAGIEPFEPGPVRTSEPLEEPMPGPPREAFLGVEDLTEGAEPAGAPEPLIEAGAAERVAADVGEALDALFGRGQAPAPSRGRVRPPTEPDTAAVPAAAAGVSAAARARSRIITEIISPEPARAAEPSTRASGPAPMPGGMRSFEPSEPSFVPPFAARRGPRHAAVEPLSAASLEPLSVPESEPLPAGALEPLPPSPPPAESAAVPSRAGAPGASPAVAMRVLIVEDSFTSRVFLSRQLGQLGYAVESVERASQLERAIGRGGWGVVFLDVELPDARGAAYLAAAIERLGRGARPALVAALTRDAADDAEARAAGIQVILRKPVERAALRRALESAGLPAGGLP
jgi:CheY-like chemotaxis protein